MIFQELVQKEFEHVFSSYFFTIKKNIPNFDSYMVTKTFLTYLNKQIC